MDSLSFVVTVLSAVFATFFYYLSKNNNFLTNLFKKKSLNLYCKLTKFTKINFLTKKINFNSYFWQKSVLQVVNKYNTFSQTRNYFNYLKLSYFIRNYVLIKTKKMLKIINNLNYLRKNIKNQYLLKRWNSGFKGNPWTPYNYRFVCYPLFTFKKELFLNIIKKSNLNKKNFLFI